MLMMKESLNYYIFIYTLLNILMFIIFSVKSDLYKYHPITLNLLMILYNILLSLTMNLLHDKFWYQHFFIFSMIQMLMILFFYYMKYFQKNFQYKFNFYFIAKLIIYALYLYFLYYETIFDIKNISYLNMKMTNFMKMMNLLSTFLNSNIFIVTCLFVTALFSTLISNHLFFMNKRQVKKMKNNIIKWLKKFL